jgi:O-antigen/teichoic acid export membrane protein
MNGCSIQLPTCDRALHHFRRILPAILYAGISAGAGLIGGVLTARQLGPELRGELAAVIAWVTVLTIGCDLGIGYASSYFVVKYPGRLSSLWTQALVIAGVLGSLLAALAGALLIPHLHLGAVHAWGALLGFSAIPLMMAASHQGYLLLGTGRVTEMNHVRFASTVSYAIGVAGLALARIRAPDAYLVVFWVAQLLSLVVATTYCRRILGAAFNFGTHGLRELVHYGAKTQLGSLSAQATLRLDQLIMSLFLQPVELGLYVVAVALSSLVGPLFAALTLVSTPAILHAGTRARGAAQARKHIALALAFACPASFACILAAKPLLRFLFGPQFAPAFTITRVLMGAALFQGVNQVSGAALRSLGKPGRTSIAESAGMVVTVLLLAILLPMIGALGAAVASLAAYMVVAVIQVFPLLIEDDSSDASALAEGKGISPT